MVTKLGRTLCYRKAFLGNAYVIYEVNIESYIGSINEKYLKNYKPIITKIKILIT